MMHHNTKFGNKMFGGLEGIIWTNINFLTLHCDLDPECGNPGLNFFFLTGYSGFMMLYHPTKFGCQGINSSENIIEKIIF